MTWDVIVGDCREVMAGMAEASVDAIVTDPPYELGFMGKAWDRSGVAFDAATWAATLRVLKPGGHLLAFGGSRTFHRIAVAIEDAGFDIRDTISWLYGSGFPKSHDVSKAMDREAGAERPIVSKAQRVDGKPRNYETWSPHQTGSMAGTLAVAGPNITAPATDLARQWDGWGTALKPAWEPVIVARKPLIGTVARNVAAYGTGAINVDACRVDPAGRWPANVILDEEAGAMLDAQTGDRPSSEIIAGGRMEYDAVDAFFPRKGYGRSSGYGDTGGASRFFYCAKASRGERNAGLEGMAERATASTWGDIGPVDGNPRKPATGHVPTVLNHHPTVKPIALMRYLARLVTPPGGVVLDPFTGSGTTGCAAALEGFGFVGVEMSPEYAEIARRRIAHWGRQIPLEVPR